MARGARQGSTQALCLGAAIALGLAATAALAEEPPAELRVTVHARPDFFGTIALPGPSGRWSEAWARILAEPTGTAALQSLVAPVRAAPRLEQLRFVQREVDRRISWRSDGTQYGRRTHWATAAETLASGRGDDDDRAILKFQALRALGVGAGDVYLVMGRDTLRGEYVLVAARAGRRWWLLEEQGDALLPAEQRSGFQPFASFGAGRAWVHGRARVASAATGAAAAGAR